MTEGTYERIIQIVRVCTAVAFALSGTGLVLCANLGLRESAFKYGMAAVASLAVVAILIAEQLVAAWIRSKRARYSVATLLVLMTACCVPSPSCGGRSGSQWPSWC